MLFSGMDLTHIMPSPKRGPSRPLNFFGYLTSKTMDQLENALISKPYNHTFVASSARVRNNRECSCLVCFTVFALPYLHHGVWCFEKGKNVSRFSQPLQHLLLWSPS